MQAFSSTVRDLYALAEYASPDQFLTRAISIMQSWIRFDGAIFGTGEAGLNQTMTLLKSDAAAPAVTVPETLLSAPQFNHDPVAQGMRNAPLSPTRGGIRELYRKSRDGKKCKAPTVQGALTLSEELGLSHLMIHGDDPSRVQPARWIVLYRQHDVRFAETDAACLHGLWIHLSRALAINRNRVKERLTQSHANGHAHAQARDNADASGLITLTGEVELADQRFFDLLEREWPDTAPECIPAEVMEILSSGKSFRGTQIEITLIKQNGCHMCRIRPVGAMEILSPREFIVARRFAAGMSHKQIARELGVSHHTVRNQLAHLYRKLNLHDKASLARYLVTNSVPV